MSTPDFSTAENNQELANEVSCLKAMLTLMLQAMGQADAGRVMLKLSLIHISGLGKKVEARSGVEPD